MANKLTTEQLDAARQKVWSALDDDYWQEDSAWAKDIRLIEKLLGHIDAQEAELKSYRYIIDVLATGDEAQLRALYNALDEPSDGRRERDQEHG